MTVTINVNGLSLVHAGSGGIAIATLPDVCLTPGPSGSVPVPYPNVARSADLADGSVDVTADGGNSIAVKGSRFAQSMGDEAGSGGGVASGTFGKEATWLSYSMDVKIEGKNACRLSDKMLMNHGNTAVLGGVINPNLRAAAAGARAERELEIVCAHVCACLSAAPFGAAGQLLMQICVSGALAAEDAAANWQSTIKPEIWFDMTQDPPRPLMTEDARGMPTTRPVFLPFAEFRAILMTAFAQGRVPWDATSIAGYGLVRRPDVTVVDDPLLPPRSPNIRAIFEIKFGFQPWGPGQRAAYQDIAESGSVIEVTPEGCGCVTGQMVHVKAERTAHDAEEEAAARIAQARRRERIQQDIVVVGGIVIVAGAIALAVGTAGTSAPQEAAAAAPVAGAVGWLARVLASVLAR